MRVAPLVNVHFCRYVPTSGQIRPPINVSSLGCLSGLDLELCRTFAFKNNLPRSGAFFDVKDMAAKAPHQPHKPPQIHHDLPPQNHPKSAKPPVKDHIDTP